LPIQKLALLALMDWRWIGLPERAAMRVKGAEAVSVAWRTVLVLGLRRLWRGVVRAKGRRERRIAVVVYIVLI